MKAMKMLKTFLFVLDTILVSSTLYSCLDDDGYSLDKFSVGVATVKPLGNNSYYLQWDDSISFWPAAGVTTPNFDVSKERRAFINFTLLGPGKDMNIEQDYVIRLNRIDTVLTKSIAPDLGDKNDEYYGEDPVTMKSVWIEDGYINFQFATYFEYGSKHFMNLVKMEDSDTYELEFRHNANGSLSGAEGWGLASFRLNSLPETGGETVKMKIKYKSYEGDKTIELKYKSGSATGRAPVMGAENFQTTN